MFAFAFGAFAFWLRLRFVRFDCVCVLRFGCVLKIVSQLSVLRFGLRFETGLRLGWENPEN